eukprot:2553700-Pyramimonas_sp.AAC.1
MGQVISEVRVGRMSQAKVARPLWRRASPMSELTGCLRRNWPHHLSSGHLETQSSSGGCSFVWGLLRASRGPPGILRRPLGATSPCSASGRPWNRQRWILDQNLRSRGARIVPNGRRRPDSWPENHPRGLGQLRQWLPFLASGGPPARSSENWPGGVQGPILSGFRLG